jgi:DNA repair protein RecN (Recombination protein N)
VASGGELSRIMLCIKSLVAKKLQLPTLIFDEIDTGISGEAAKQVGAIMQELAQISPVDFYNSPTPNCRKGNCSLFCLQSIKGDKVTTSIRVLNNDERITNIAQMLSGEKPTAAALANAKEMVGN